MTKKRKRNRRLEQSGSSKQQAPTDYPTHPSIPFTSAVRSDGRDEWASVRRRVRSADDAFRLLKRQPAERLQLQSTLLFRPKGTAAPTNVPGETRAAAEIWYDNTWIEEIHVRGRLVWCDSISQSESRSEQWTQWQEWLATAGMLLEFVDPPAACTASESIKYISNPLRRWLYLLHVFSRSEFFTWDLSADQLKGLWQRCEELGHGHPYHDAGEGLVFGAAAGQRISIDGICSINELPNFFHVCSEVRDVLHVSEQLLSSVEPSWDNFSIQQELAKYGSAVSEPPGKQRSPVRKDKGMLQVGEKLRELHIKCLKALRSLRARSETTRRTATEVAEKVDRHYDATNVKEAMADLAKWGYVDSRRGRPPKGTRGGSFITQSGLGKLKKRSKR